MNLQRRAANIAFMFHDNDASWKGDLVGHMAMLRRNGLIAFVESAKYMVMPRIDIILVLVSSDFLADDKLVNAVYYAIDNQQRGQRIIYISVRKVNIEEDFPRLYNLQGLPRNGRTLESARLKSEILGEIVDEIRSIVKGNV